MGLLEDIKKDATKVGTTLNNDIETSLEQKFNSLFYLDKNIDEEIMFLRHVMTRGQETQERKGLHASAIIVSDDKFCLRQQVLSLVYKQKQGEQLSVDLMRIFEEGNAIHEKWQRLFIRGGLSNPLELDATKYNKQFDLQYTPDIICTIDGEKMVGEIKSVNTYSFQKQTSHPSGKKQLQLYMYLTGIKKGFVLCEDKNTQKIKVYYYKFDYDVVKPFVARLEQIQFYKNKLLKHNRLVKRHQKCTSVNCGMAQKCPMQDVCWRGKKEKL